MPQKSSPRLATLAWTPPFRRRVPKSMFSGSWGRALLDGTARECAWRSQNSLEGRAKNKSNNFFKTNQNFRKGEKNQILKSGRKSCRWPKVRQNFRALRPRRFSNSRSERGGVGEVALQHAGWDSQRRQVVCGRNAFFEHMNRFLFQKNLRIG